MPKYTVSFKSSAAKELRKLSLEVQQRIANAIEKLIDNPRFSGVVKLKGDNNLYRFRVGDSQTFLVLVLGLNTLCLFNYDLPLYTTLSYYLMNRLEDSRFILKQRGDRYS